MNHQELVKKITEKKEFSQLPLQDVEMALEKFENKNLNEYQKVKLTRQFLRKIFSSFSSRKVFSSKGKDFEWYLLKHKSTKERFANYLEVYHRCLKGLNQASVIDLGAGINGLSYYFFEKERIKVNYTAVEAIGQFVELMNDFFKENNLSKSAKAFQMSLFNLEQVREIILAQNSPRVIFLFKVVDSLEVMSRNYSKILLNEISLVSDRIIVSFATKSLGSRKNFGAQRKWLITFIGQNFEILDDFQIEGERYISFKKRI